jgi:hypothetical protein
MWKTLVDFSAQISRFKHILPLSTAQINCSGSDLPLFRKPYFCLVLRMAAVRILMDGAYAHLAACYKRTTDHCIAELNGCLTPGAWLKSSCLAGCFFQESPSICR